MAPTTRSRKSLDATSGAHAGSNGTSKRTSAASAETVTTDNAKSKSKQLKLEDSAGFDAKDGSGNAQDEKKATGEGRGGSNDGQNDGGEVKAGDKRERQDDFEAKDEDDSNKVAKVGQHDEQVKKQDDQVAESEKHASSSVVSDGDKIVPGSEKPPQVLQPGAEEDAKNNEDDSYEVLEEGHIYFFYRPKVTGADEYDKNEKAVDSIDDVQNTHMLLIPQASKSSTAPADPAQAAKAAEKASDANGGQGQQSVPAGTTGEKARKEGIGFRLIRLGKKRLPAPEEAIERGLQPGGIGGDSSEAVWSVIADVGADVSQLSGEMGERRYSTRTRGERVVGPSRIAGRGRYSFVLHKTSPPSARQVRLCYALSHPSSTEEMGTVQKELGLLSSSSVLISMRNPTLPATGEGAPPAGLPESQRVELGKGQLQETFGGSVNEGGTRYARPEDVELLDREGVEMLLTRERIGGGQSNVNGAASGSAEEQASALEKLAQQDGKNLSIDDVLAELSQSTKKTPPDALEGTWV